MNELELKYGCNPNQKPSRIFMKDGSDLPVTVLSGKRATSTSSNCTQLLAAREGSREATGLPAASFNTSRLPARQSARRSRTWAWMYFVDDEGELSAIACAYIRARGADRMSSYGDWAALSDTCDARTATYLKHEVSDGIIAPSYTDEALEILRAEGRHV